MKTNEKHVEPNQQKIDEGTPIQLIILLIIILLSISGIILKSIGLF
ncbi:MAG: hypothetical protein HZB59_06595 [Ignavibacteriales bacterium]|nr:hypothetical protein [Ignavibacteriales bacterium]